MRPCERASPAGEVCTLQRSPEASTPLAPPAPLEKGNPPNRCQGREGAREGKQLALWWSWAGRPLCPHGQFPLLLAPAPPPPAPGELISHNCQGLIQMAKEGSGEFGEGAVCATRGQPQRPLAPLPGCRFLICGISNQAQQLFIHLFPSPPDSLHLHRESPRPTHPARPGKS